MKATPDSPTELRNPPEANLLRDIVRSRAAIGVLTIGVVLSCVAALTASRSLRQNERALLETESTRAGEMIALRAARDLDGLRHVQELVAADGTIDPNRLGSVILEALRQGPSLQEVGFARPSDGRIRVERAARRDGQAVGGRDLASDPARGIAYERARDGGVLVAIAGGGGPESVPPALLALLPVYRPGLPVGSIPERRRAFAGLAYAQLSPTALLLGSSAGVDNPETALSLEWIDVDPREAAALGPTLPQHLIHAQRSITGGTDLASARLIEVDLAGQPTTLAAWPGTAFRPPGSYLPPCVLAVGLAFSLLLFALVGALRSERARVHAFAEEMTADLRAREAAIRSLQVVTAEAKEAAEAASRAKSDFLANMSHEIRTPMNAVLGFADLLLNPDLQSSYRLNYVQTIRRSAEQLLSIINDILDLSKIEAGKMTFERIPCSPSQILVDVASLMRARAGEKKLAFEVKYRGPIPERIVGDPTRIRQILMNLVGNAIKFTDSGSVRVTARLDGSDPKRPRITFAVADTGVGMTREQFERLFRPFTQADASTTRRFGGTGLGLVICRRLASLLGATITAESEIGRGSTFTFTIETGELDGVKMLVDLEEGGLSPHSSPGERRVAIRIAGRVLLAEDGHDNQVLISTHLRKAGAEAVIAANGRIAVDLALAAQAEGRPFGLILMDMQMPELDGYGTTALLRSRGYSRPIVALTAHAMVGDRERCINAGCDDYMTKPVKRNTLLALVDHYLSGAAACASELRAPLEQQSASSPDVPLTSEFADDEDMGEIIDRFVAQLSERSLALVEAYRARDHEQIHRLAHQLKGAAGGFGFSTITDAAAAVVQAIREPARIADLGPALENLVALCRRARGRSPQWTRSEQRSVCT
ncbi:MAG: response regulator [Myxococcales bacterium]|nr:response regulator [Myxococcales bacterium]